MWVQLTSIQHIEKAGVMNTYHPGDWVEVGKQMAMMLLANGQARVPSGSVVEGSMKVMLPGNIGVVVPPGRKEGAKSHLKNFEVEEGLNAVIFERTAIWDGQVYVPEAYFMTGFYLLEKWEVAAPLYDYKMLAITTGTEKEREKTKEIIRDLRVPMYDTRLIFVKRTKNGQELLRQWNLEVGEERRLAFLRALYKVKPLVLALPATWMGFDYAR